MQPTMAGGNLVVAAKNPAAAERRHVKKSHVSKSKINTPCFTFGPVYLQRLGRSLGIDLVPLKTCVSDC
jgi:hypothetical protein